MMKQTHFAATKRVIIDYGEFFELSDNPEIMRTQNYKIPATKDGEEIRGALKLGDYIFNKPKRISSLDYQMAGEVVMSLPRSSGHGEKIVLW